MARVGIIGTGWGARVQVPAFLAAGLDVTGLAGHDYSKTRDTAAGMGIDRAYDRWQELVESGDIDLVSIVTPPSEHADMAIAALQNGKHVLSEKPTAMNVAEAARMLSVSRLHSNQIALIDHELRFLPSWLAARQRFAEIGMLRSVEVRYSSASRGDPSRAWSWWSDENRGGGVLGAVGSHVIDSIRYLAAEIESVRAYLHSFVAERPLGAGTAVVTADDFCEIDLRLAGGAFAHAHLSGVATRDEPTCWTFHGSEGGIRLSEDRLEMASRGGEWEEQSSQSSEPVTGDSSGGHFGTGTVHLARALRAALDDGDHGALKPAATFEDGLQQQRVIDGARESHRQGGGWVSVPPP